MGTRVVALYLKFGDEGARAGPHESFDDFERGALRAAGIEGGHDLQHGPAGYGTIGLKNAHGIWHRLFYVFQRGLRSLTRVATGGLAETT